MGYDNTVLMQKEIALAPPGELITKQRVSNTNLSNYKRHECIPFWGEAPLYTEILFRLAVMTPIIIFVFVPLLSLLWLLFASIYYIFWGAEYRRREIIEKKFKELKAQ